MATSRNALPDGWILRVSRSKGKVFYYNTHTKLTQWTRPTAADTSAPIAGVASVSPVAVADVVVEDSVLPVEKKRKLEKDAATATIATTSNFTTSANSMSSNKASERHAAITRCMRVGASSGGSNEPFAPWEHQVDAVDKMLSALDQSMTTNDDSRANRFLFQHSTGSGKTVTIAALTHQLLYFHDHRGHRFHTVVLLIDRIKLDEQVGDSVERFLRRNGIDAVYRATSIDHLATLLTSDETGGPAFQRVIITTIQKIGLLAKNPVLLTRLLHGNQSDAATLFTRAAILTDEAHRSHTAATRQTIEAIMKGGDDDDSPQHDDTSSSSNKNNISFMGFTATPNAEALELFGSTARENGDDGEGHARVPFHCYSMSQAVADNRVVDVLQNYQSVRCVIETSIPEDVKAQLARRGLMRRVMESASGDIEVLKAKIAFLMADFEKKKSAWSRAKCMIVTRSRRDVVRYYELVSAFVRNKQLPWRAFAVFSGAVAVDPTSTSALRNVTEQSLNPKHTTLASSDIVIVCDKLDTGYSDPLLACMYVDRYLRSSVQTVQLFSRLNRKHPDKRHVHIVDFANHAAQIRRHFATFWQEARTCGGDDHALTPLAQVRTPLLVLNDALAPWKLQLDDAHQVQQTMEDLIRSLDRDAWQQLVDALRNGVAAWDALEGREPRRVVEGISPLRRRHLISLKTLVEQAMSSREEEEDDDAKMDVDEIVQQMKTRVQQYQVMYKGSIDPMQLHTNRESGSIFTTKKAKTAPQDDLQVFESLLGFLVSMYHRTDANMVESLGELVKPDVAAASTKSSRLSDSISELATHILQQRGLSGKLTSTQT